MIEVRHLVKRFGRTVALDGVDLAVAAGETVALMGANGAGKSTLVKILGGALLPDAGSIEIDGIPVRLAPPARARAAGVVAVHQAVDRGNVPSLTVADNLLLDELCTGRAPRWLSPRTIRARAAPVAARVGLERHLGAVLATLTLAERQLVAIARGLAAEKRLLIIDEPTASLSHAEAARLHDVLDAFRARGGAVLLVSHRQADIERAADRAVVLRDGRIVGQFARPVDTAAALRATIGTLPDTAHARVRRAADPILTVSGLRLRPDGVALDLTLRGGEIVVLFGPLGVGKSRLLLAMFGATAPSGGAMTLDGRPWTPRSPADAIRAGVFLAAADRWRTSFARADARTANLADTIALPHLPRWTGTGGWAPTRRTRQATLDAIRELRIVCRGPDDRLAALSGGNQQKVVLARWSAMPARVLLLDEPFAGVDARARADLIATLRGLGSDTAVLVATSDAAEALEAADRVLVLDREGLRDGGRPFGDDGALRGVAGALQAASAA